MAVVGLVAAEGDAIQLEIVDAVFLLILQHGVGEQAAVILAGDAEIAAVGGDLHAVGLAGGDADLALVVAADGAEPDAQVAVDALERGGEIVKAVGKALLVDLPELVHVVPAVVEDEGIEMQAVFGEQQFLKIGDARQGVVVIHVEARIIVPGVVEQIGTHGSDAHACYVVEELLVDQAGRRHAHDGGLAGIAAVGDVQPDVAAEGDLRPVGGVDAGGIFQAEEEIFGEQRLSEAAEGESRHAPFIAGGRHPFEKQRALLRLGEMEPLAGEEIGRIEFVDQIDGQAACRREVQSHALAAGGCVVDVAARDARSGGGVSARVFVAEAVAHPFIVEFDFELAAAKRVGAAGDLIDQLARADVAIGNRDGALQIVVGEDDGGGAGTDYDRSGSEERGNE